MEEAFESLAQGRCPECGTVIETQGSRFFCPRGCGEGEHIVAVGPRGEIPREILRMLPDEALSQVCQRLAGDIENVPEEWRPIVNELLGGFADELKSRRAVFN